MNKKVIMLALIAIPLLGLAGLFVYSFYVGPRMKVQPHIRAFQMVAPPRPEGSATVEVPERLPSPGTAAGVKNPVPATAATLRRGSVYYHYYCVFCHGEEGAGNGPVGESFVPVPADLRSARVRGYRDGELLRAMLTGMGHEPVLERVVPPRHRWYVVLYVQSLARQH